MNRAAWIAALRTAFDDADAAARDMLRRPSKRGLGPAQHRKLYRDAAKQIRALLDRPPGEASGGAAPATPDEADPAAPEIIDGSPRGRATPRHGDLARDALLHYFEIALGSRMHRWEAAVRLDAAVDDIVDAAVVAARDRRYEPGAPRPPFAT